MARIPDVAGESQQPVPQPSGGVATYEPPNWRQVGMAGQIVSGAGRELEQASEIVAATNERQDTLDAQAAANQLQQQRITQEFDPQTGFRNAKQGQAVGQQFVDANTAKFNEGALALRDGLANENQRRIYDQHARVQGLQFKSALLQHQAQETERFNDSTANSSIDLALRTMAQKPTDELNFQTGLTQINGTLDATAKRKGLPDEQLADLKSKYLDAAYSTRITSIMDGIPGVAAANPYMAEKMFRQVQDQLGPASQVHLAAQVQKAVQSVQARDTAQGLIYGRAPTRPSDIAPAVNGAPLAAVVRDMESGGNPDAVSAKGAQGAMQVMPMTQANPGFGVRPAQVGADGKTLPGELDRVGRDYLGAMTARYDAPALVMAAYNAGPGALDDWMHGTNDSGKNPSRTSIGDPRTGQVSTEDWIRKIPFAETQAYVTNGLRKLNAAAGQPDAPIQAPTANQLKTDLFARVQYARNVAEQQYPGDTAYADAVAARTENYGRLVLSNQQAVEAGARDGLFQGIVGPNANGTGKPLTIDQLLADPQMKANWDKATPEAKLAIQTHFKNGAGDPPRTPDTQQLYYTMLGQAATNREVFANADLSPLIAQLPHADFDRLATLQMGARNKAERDADKQTNLLHALTLANDYALKPARIPIPNKDTPQAQRALYDQFTGRLSEQIDQFQAANKRVPNDKEIVGIARSLTTTVQVPGKWWGTADKRAFEIQPDQESTVSAALTDQDKSRLSAGFSSRYGRPPQDSELQALRVAELLHGNDPTYLRQLDAQIRTNKAKP